MILLKRVQELHPAIQINDSAKEGSGAALCNTDQ
jgi:hypothetical protein